MIKNDSIYFNYNKLLKIDLMCQVIHIYLFQQKVSYDTKFDKKYCIYFIK